MFDKTILHRSNYQYILSAGDLAEALLFYREIHLVLDERSLINLSKQMGVSTLLGVLCRPNVTADFCEDALSVMAVVNDSFQQELNFISTKSGGSEKFGKVNSRKQHLDFIFQEKLNIEKKQAERFAERFRVKVPFRNLTGDSYIKGGVLNFAKNEMQNNKFLHDSVRILLNAYIGVNETPNNFMFNLIKNDNGFQIKTDLDFDKMNNIASINHSKEISKSSLALDIMESFLDLILASHYKGDFITSEINSSFINHKNSDLLKSTNYNANELNEFHNIVVGKGPRISDVINSKEKTFDEFIKLLDKSDKFRDWAKNIQPDAKLVAEYWRDITREGWASSLPAKTIRYSICTVTGAFEPITGSILSFADTFLLEKLAKGWRPNHFIDKNFKPFLSK